MALNETAWLALLAYLAELGAIDAARAKDLAAEYAGLRPALARQLATLVTEEKASALYLGALKALLASERAVLRELGGGNQSAMLGWGGGKAPLDDLEPLPGEGPRPGQHLLGWRDDQGVYLIADAAYTAVCAFLQQGGQRFGFTKQAVHEQLASDGLLARTDPQGARRW